MVGRRPTPTALKVLRGKTGHGALNTKEPTPAAMTSGPPAHLSAVGLAEWHRIVPILLASRVLTEMDYAALSAYCGLWSRWVEAEAYVQAHGATVTSPNGYEIASPYLTIANKALMDLRLYAVEFGLTPSSRSRVSVAGEKGKDELADFLYGVE